MKYIVDNNELWTYKDLKERLLSEIKQETIDNNEDIDIVKGNMDLLEKISGGNYVRVINEDYMVEQLESFGYEIIKQKDIEEILTCLKIFFGNYNEKVLSIKTENLLEDIRKYFVKQ